jgi:hypothetical protein
VLQTTGTFNSDFEGIYTAVALGLREEFYTEKVNYHDEFSSLILTSRSTLMDRIFYKCTNNRLVVFVQVFFFMRTTMELPQEPLVVPSSTSRPNCAKNLPEYGTMYPDGTLLLRAMYRDPIDSF